MAASTYAGAVRAGTHAASRLIQQLHLRPTLEAQRGSVDVFSAIEQVDLPLLMRPLQGLLGAFIRVPTAAGVLVTTQRPMSIQRFTAAHELGHWRMDHQPSLDDENFLRRLEREDGFRTGDFQEVEANAFAAEFLMPRWLVQMHAACQGWSATNLRHPARVYQLSLRLGTSYEATCWTLRRQNVLTLSDVLGLMETKPKVLKEQLLQGYRPEDYRGDVWLLTERDAGTHVNGSRNDLFVLRLQEHSGSGYLWDIDQLRASGFAVVRDDLEGDAEGIGTPLTRRVTATTLERNQGRLHIAERRPWNPSDPLSFLEVNYDFSGPEEEGLSRAERKKLLEAA